MYSRTCFFGRTSRDPHERFEVRVEVRVQVQVPPYRYLTGSVQVTESKHCDYWFYGDG